MPKLKANQPCPLHRGSKVCCGRSKTDRTKVRKQGHGIWQFVRSGLWRAPDGREKCSTAELRRRKDQILRQGVKCQACGEGFQDYRDVELAHRQAKGLGGAFHDSRLSNLTLLHARANRECGSLDIQDYIANRWKPEHCL